MCTGAHIKKLAPIRQPPLNSKKQILMIAKYLIENFKSRIENFFASKTANDWKNKYEKAISKIDHDEPWLTLIACYSALGNLENIDENNLTAINEVFKFSGITNKLSFTSITKVKVEEKLPEIINYRTYLKDALAKENFHLYPDRKEIISKKLLSDKASFEGNTNLDLLIEGVSQERKITCFIEAKFLSDISYQTKYNPARDQIIRNIDCGIDYVMKKNHAIDLKDFYFFLLTPQVFRINEFGNKKESIINNFGADSSRLYCYKMHEYRDYKILKKNLPHRNLSDTEWKSIANNIGWLTFEDFYKYSNKNSTLNNNEEKMVKDYFEARNLVNNTGTHNA
jgi:hypothetical protein